MFLFPSSLQDPSIPHQMYEEEFKSALSVTDNVYLIDFAALLQDNFGIALNKIPINKDERRKIIYFGWMLTIEKYKYLYECLLKKGYNLLTNPVQYTNCHWFDHWYDFIDDLTFKSSITYCSPAKFKLFDHKPFIKKEIGLGPFIIRDYVSSQKRNWNEACFIPSLMDDEHFEKVVNKFIELQNNIDGVQGELVFRQYCHGLSEEIRYIVLNGKVIAYGYHNDSEKKSIEIPKTVPRIINDILKRKINSPFYVIDIAKKSDGRWVCVEIGDGQVSTLPQGINQKKFFQKLLDGIK